MTRGSESKESIQLGKALQAARQKAGMTQQELCHAARLSYSTLAKIERGAIKTPSVFTVARIAATLGLTMDELMEPVIDTKAKSLGVKRKSKNGTTFLYLDINGCLVRFFHVAFTNISEEHGVPSDRVESAFWHYNDAVCSGEMSMEDFNTALAKRLGVSSIDWNSYYLHAVEAIGPMHEVLKWAAKHYKVGLLSNIMPGQVNAMMSRGLLPNITYDAIIDSSAEKAIKPQEKIYAIAEKKAGVKPDEILFVDDSRTNLVAAEHRGWHVLWFNDSHAEESAEKIRSALNF